MSFCMSDRRIIRNAGISRSAIISSRMEALTFTVRTTAGNEKFSPVIIIWIITHDIAFAQDLKNATSSYSISWIMLVSCTDTANPVFNWLPVACGSLKDNRAEIIVINANQIIRFTCPILNRLIRTIRSIRERLRRPIFIIEEPDTITRNPAVSLRDFNSPCLRTREALLKFILVYVIVLSYRKRETGSNIEERNPSAIGNIRIPKLRIRVIHLPLMNVCTGYLGSAIHVKHFLGYKTLNNIAVAVRNNVKLLSYRIVVGIHLHICARST